MFTENKIQQLQPRDNPYRIADTGGQKGLNIQITPSGTKTFFVSYVFDEHIQFLKLGRFPMLTLNSARSLADQALEIVNRGDDPKNIDSKPVSLAELLKEFSPNDRRGIGAGLGFGSESSKHKKLILEFFQESTPVSEVSQGDMVRFSKFIRQKNLDSSGNESLKSFLFEAFAFGMERELVPVGDGKFLRSYGIRSNPVLAFDAGGVATGNNRVLSQKELLRLFQGMHSVGNRSMPADVANIVRIVLFTCQRLTTLLRLKKEDINLRSETLTLTIERSGKEVVRVIPLSGPLKILLYKLIKDSEGQIIFPAARGSQKPKTASNLNRSIKSFCMSQGIEPFSAKTLINTSINHLENIGASETAIQALKSMEMGSAGDELQFVFDALGDFFGKIDSLAIEGGALDVDLDTIAKLHEFGFKPSNHLAMLELCLTDPRCPLWLKASLKVWKSEIEQGKDVHDALGLRADSQDELKQVRAAVVYHAGMRLRDKTNLPLNDAFFYRLAEEPDIKSVGVKTGSNAKSLYYYYQNFSSSFKE